MDRDADTTHAHQTRRKQNPHRRLWLPWVEAYQELLFYVETIGPASKIPRDYVTNDGFRLGIWVYTQQYAKANQMLGPGRVELLEKVESWSWNRREEDGSNAATILRNFIPELDRSSNVPLYQQAAGILRHYISEGLYQPGDRFPSEKELMKYFGVGQDTVKMAVHQLRDQGLVRFVRSRGVFVSEPVGPSGDAT